MCSGGTLSPVERIIGAPLGAPAVHAIGRGETGKMAGVMNRQTVLTPFEEAIRKDPAGDTTPLILLTGVLRSRAPRARELRCGCCSS